MTKFPNSLYLRMEADLRVAIRDAAVAAGPEYTDSSLAREVLRSAFLSKTKEKEKEKKKRPRARQIAQIAKEVFAIWDEEMPLHISRPATLSDKRRAQLGARLKECEDLELWRYAIKAISLSPWHMGEDEKNATNWTADIDYLLSASHFASWIDAGKELQKHGVPTKAHPPSSKFVEMMRERDRENEASS